MKNTLIPILMYHRFIESTYESNNTDIYVNIKTLEKQFEFLKKHNFITLTFEDLKKDKHKKSDKKIIITIDDGYLDNYYLLFPL